MIEYELVTDGILEGCSFDIPKVIAMLEDLQISLEWEQRAKEKTEATGLRHGHYKCPSCKKMQVARHKTEVPFVCALCGFEAKTVGGA